MCFGSVLDVRSVKSAPSQGWGGCFRGPDPFEQRASLLSLDAATLGQHGLDVSPHRSLILTWLGVRVGVGVGAGVGVGLDVSPHRSLILAWLGVGAG